jgi:hypothetical protein
MQKLHGERRSPLRTPPSSQWLSRLPLKVRNNMVPAIEAAIVLGLCSIHVLACASGRGAKNRRWTKRCGDRS